MPAVIIACAVAAALTGGVFFAFSVFVMRALAELPPAQGIRAMQRINVTVINPLFLGVFVGTVVLLGVAAWFSRHSAQAFACLLGAFLIYLAGSVGVTMACNVPRNNRLAALEAGSAEARAYWPVYMREWLAWNHVRCIACLAAAVVAMLAMAAGYN